MSSLSEVRSLTARVIAARSAAPASMLDRLTVGDMERPFTLSAAEGVASWIDAIAARLAAACDRAGRRVAGTVFDEPTERYRIVRPGGLGGTRIARRTMKELLS